MLCRLWRLPKQMMTGEKAPRQRGPQDPAVAGGRCGANLAHEAGVMRHAASRGRSRALLLPPGDGAATGAAALRGTHRCRTGAASHSHRIIVMSL